MVLFPIGWDLIGWAALLLAGTAPAPKPNTVAVKFLLPPGIPSGGELLGGRTLIGEYAEGSLLLSILFMLAGAFVKAGYLHVMTGALQSEETGWGRFMEGVKYYGGRMLAWHALLAVVLLAMALLAGPMQGAAIILVIPALVAVVGLYLTDFLIVARDLEVGEALRSSPGMLAAHFRLLLVVALASAASSAALSLLLSISGLQTLLLAAPLWGWFGTWAGMAVVATLLQPVPETP